MNPESFLKEIRDQIARDELGPALLRLRQFLDNTPQLDGVLQQSGRFAAIRDQIRMGTVSHAEATLTQNQIRDGLLDFLREIDVQQAQSSVLGEEMERAISIVQSKNMVAGSTISGQNVNIGDRQEIHHHYGDKKIPRNLTNPPFDPPVFLGREAELEALHARIFGSDDFLMLVNGQGGMGKTSFAAKYWKRYQHEYQHRAFFFVGNGIENALLGLAPTLEVTFPDTMPGRERLKLLLQHIAELERPCLLVLDNANDAAELDALYPLLRTCNNCHLLLTSRLAALRESPTHPIGALPDELALQLFQRHYPQHRAEDDVLFFRILRAVGGNTLVVELLAKNLRSINTNEVFYSLGDLLTDLQGQGLLRLREQAAIQVDWQQFEKSTPEQIVSAMYDLRPLAPEALALLSAFSVLPAEDISYDLLKTLLAPAEARAFSQQLSNLHQQGWLEKNDINARPHYKCSPVVQEVVRNKNPQLLADCEGLIDQLNEKLDYETGSGHLLNASYEEAALFARYAETVVQGIGVPGYDLGILCERIASYYTTTGDLGRALLFQEKYLIINRALLAAEPDNAAFKNGLAISYEKLGETHSSLGNLSQAMAFFEQANQLEKELQKDYPENMDFKHGLAISYRKLGSTHSALGNHPQALALFKQYYQQSIELHEAFPANLPYKNSLAISFSDLGSAYIVLGDLSQALTLFEQYNQLEKELHEAYPAKVSFKNSLAISYEKLGSTHKALGNLPKALAFFAQETKLFEELQEAYPANVSFKEGLGWANQFLGNCHYSSGNLDSALTQYSEMKQIFKGLKETYPQKVKFKNGLAISYSKLGTIHSALGNLPQALASFEQFNQLIQELHEAYPVNVDFKKGLAISNLFLGQFHWDQLKDRIKARDYLQQGYALYEALVRDFPDYQEFKGNYEWVKKALAGLEG